jgi:hypothetical protein
LRNNCTGETDLARCPMGAAASAMELYRRGKNYSKRTGYAKKKPLA